MSVEHLGRTAVPSHNIEARTEINVRGVIALRWVAISGQLLTILVVQGLLGISLPLKPLYAVLGATALMNAGLMFIRQLEPPYRPKLSSNLWEHILGLTMLFDLAALTALLDLTGGISNPFCLFYFVNIVLAAIVLPQPWVWSLTLFGVLCIGVLTTWSRPLSELDAANALGPQLLTASSISRVGVYVAYATCSSVIVMFVTRIRGQLELREEHVRQLAQAQARNDRLDSLGTLAAGAAHELATPLSTIAVIAKELQQEVGNPTSGEQTAEDIALIRSELDRCRTILNRMSKDAGLVIGESIAAITVSELIRECSNGVDSRYASLKLALEPGIESQTLRAPLEGLSQAIRAIVKNAIDATPYPQDVVLHAAMSDSKLFMKIEDHGVGIDPQTLSRIGEPFFTTKEPGKGMGLGVYLARNVVERLGGTIQYASTPGSGTVVSITIPRDCTPGREFESDAVGNSAILF